MKAFVALTSLVLALASLPAAAQQGGGSGPGAQRGPRDCSQTADPAACNAHRDAHRKMMDACKGKAGPERQQCMHEQAQNVDCGKARNPQQCEARKQAYGECKDQQGPAFKQCVQQKMPPADCSKAADPQRCERHQKAREACKDKVGPEHRSCLRDILAPAK